ncbi:MAG: cation diffusion facilitator family transporter [Gemmatimonadaceae bacterium]
MRDASARAALVRRSQWYSRITLFYNSLEGIVSIGAGIMAGSVALVGFGMDSVIEVVSSLAALWRLKGDADVANRERSERIALRVIGSSFLALACYVLADAAHALYAREMPEKSVPGLVITVLSVVIMPVLSRAKRRIALGLGSRALTADAAQTNLCAYLSAIALAGLFLNAALGWWWADPVAALVMVPIIAREGVQGWRGEEHCDECA